MKKLLLISSLFVASTASANMYVGASLGGSYAITKDVSASYLTESASISSPDEKTVFNASLAVGYDFTGKGSNGRLELQYTTRGNASSSKDYTVSSSLIRGEGHGTIETQSDTLMLNYMYDVPVESTIKPYLLIGVGMSLTSAEVKADGIKVSDNGTDFAVSLGLGAQKEVAENVNFNVFAKYTSLGSSEITDNRVPDAKIEMDSEAIDFGIGLNYYF